MNKKEFIKTLTDMSGHTLEKHDWDAGWDAAISEVLEVANELDEAEEVGVSKKESKVDLRYYKEALEELNNDVCNLTYHHKESVEALYKNLLKLTKKLIEECEVE